MPVLFDLLLVHDLLLDLFELLFIVAVQHLGGSDENVFHSLSTLGRCFKIEVNSFFLLKGSGFLLRHCSLSLKVFLGPDQEHQNIFVPVLL